MTVNRPVLQSSDRIGILNVGEATFPLLRFLRTNERSSSLYPVRKAGEGVCRFSSSRKR
jgi:hypothetical protein